MSKNALRSDRSAAAGGNAKPKDSLAAARANELQKAIAHHQGGRLNEAEIGYRKFIEADPTSAAVFRLLGLAVMGRGDLAQAIVLFEEAIRLTPTFVEAHLGLGNAHAAQGKLPEAEADYGRVLALDPKHLEALNNLGNCLQARRRFDEAESVFRRAIAINPKLAELNNNLGNALQAAKKPDEAIAAFREAIALKPDFPQAHSNLGNMLKAENQLSEAVESYRRALALNPNYIDALNNLANALHAQGLSSEAITTYRRSQELQPAQGDAYFYESLVHLARGDLLEGFAEYEYRWISILRHARRTFAQPIWLGESDLRGRTILLHAEQGLGDTLQFVRYASLAAERGAIVLLEVQPALKSLLTGFPGVQSIFARGDPLPAFDLHCPLLSLPHAFRTTLETIPLPGPSLHVPADRAAHWQHRLPPGPSLRIGLMWTGNLHHVNDRNRSVSLEVLRPLLGQGGVEFYSLHKDYRSADERRLATSLGIVDWAEEISDFENTAALISRLDLVISVDTSMAHLAGALGRPVWLLLPLCPDWRWLLQRPDSPWYPGMRLFRQERAGDWTQPIEAVGAALAGLTKT